MVEILVLYHLTLIAKIQIFVCWEKSNETIEGEVLPNFL